MDYYVYILTNRSRTLYVGVTNDLERRGWEHKKVCAGFTSPYYIDCLGWYERFNDIRQAIEWEKRISGWTRAKKIKLIEERNPGWIDLSGDWYPALRLESSPTTRTAWSGDPSLRLSTGCAQDDGAAAEGCGQCEGRTRRGE